MKLTKWIFILVLGYSSGSFAQYLPASWGSGTQMGGYANSCPYEYQTAEQLIGSSDEPDAEKYKSSKKEVEAKKKEVNKLTKERDRLQKKADRNEEILAKYFTKSALKTIKNLIKNPNIKKQNLGSCAATRSTECSAIEAGANGVGDGTDDKTNVTNRLGEKIAELKAEAGRCITPLVKDPEGFKNIFKNWDADSGSTQSLLDIESIPANKVLILKCIVQLNQNIETAKNTAAVNQPGAGADSVEKILADMGVNSGASESFTSFETPSEFCAPLKPAFVDRIKKLIQGSEGNLATRLDSTCVNFLKENMDDSGLKATICNPSLQSAIARNKPGYVRPKPKDDVDASDCQDAFEDFAEQFGKLEETKDALKLAETKLESAKDQSKDSLEDALQSLMNKNELLEADCEHCENRYRRAPSMWDKAFNVLGLVGGAALSLYATDKISDKNARLGWPTNPYVGLSVGYPFLMAGMYGGILGGQSSGGYGCAGTMNWNGGAGGVFGFPNGMGGAAIMGGLFNSGMGPWGVAGPWGAMGPYMNSNPYGMVGIGALIGGGGIPGMAGIAGANYGGYGMAGMPGGYGMIGGYGMAGMGGIPGGYGMYGGMGGVPGGYGMAGMGGILGGYGAMGGVPGGYGMYGGMGGIPGGYGTYGGMGGIPGGYGMYGGMGGIPGGYGMYGGLAGGAGLAGMAGLAGGTGLAGMSEQYMQQMQQQMQIQMEQQQRRMQQQQSAYRTINSLTQQIQQLQAQMSTAYGSLYGYGGYGGGFNAGITPSTIINGVQTYSNQSNRPGSYR